MDIAPFSGFLSCVKENPSGIILGRRAMRSFTETQIELVTTFADQAAIAIENVRLFDEVQARTRELSASAGTADGDLRGVAGHLQFAGRAGAGVPGHTGTRDAAVRGQLRSYVAQRRRSLPQRCIPRCAAGGIHRDVAERHDRPRSPYGPRCSIPKAASDR